MLGGLALLLLLGWGGFYWHRHRERRITLQVFHWVQGSTPLQILGTPPFTGAKGDNFAPRVDPKVRDLLQQMAIGGELRLVGEIDLSERQWSQSGALLLKTKPQVRFILTLVDEPAAVYVEHGADFAVIPETGAPTPRKVTLIPGKNPQVDLFNFSWEGGDVWGGGATGVWWW
jgi:hypothetical protein